jgi:beta-lactamase class A
MTRVALLHRLRAELADGGLRGSFLVRDLRTGVEIGIDPDIEFPSASLVKIPLAAATLERIRIGELDGATQLEVEPGRATAPGPTGLTRFRHPVRIAIDDLLYLSVAISDGTASDALFELTPPDQVTSLLRAWDVQGITVRHSLDELTDTPQSASTLITRTWPTHWPSARPRPVEATRCRCWTRPGRVPARPGRTSHCCRHCGRRRRSTTRCASGCGN